MNLVVKRKPKPAATKVKAAKAEQLVTLTDEETQYKKTLEEADKKMIEENAPIEAPKTLDIHSLLS